MSRIADDFSIGRSAYPNCKTFSVTRAYETKANKVRSIDPNGTDGAMLGGVLDWFERPKASDVPCTEPRKYDDWITPKFSGIPKGARLTEERI
jgi:hypothetical protein